MPVPNFDLPPTLVRDGVAYYAVKDAQLYTGMSNTGLIKRVDRYNEEHPKDQIPKYDFGGRGRYYKKEDLDRLFAVRVAED